MMKRLLMTLMAAALVPLSVPAQQKVRFMPHWMPQAQFAGYYVAQDLGFFADEGLEVSISHPTTSSTRSTINNLLYGEVDITTQLFIPALIERSNGNRIVNVLQTSQRTGLMCISRTGIKSLNELNGKSVGRWKSGFSEIAEMFCHDYNVNFRWIPFNSNISLYVSGAVDATLAYSYSEYLGILFATGGISDDRIIRFSDLGYDYPEDGLYVTEDYFDRNPTTVFKFVSAAKRGWDYAREHPDEAVAIVMKYAGENNISTNVTYQKMMLEEVLRLQIDEKTGVAGYQKVDQTTFNNLIDELTSIDYILNPVNYKEFVK